MFTIQDVDDEEDETEEFEKFAIDWMTALIGAVGEHNTEQILEKGEGEKNGV